MDKPNDQAVQRLDKWLWYARLVKTRTLAAHLVSAGKVRINRERAGKPSRSIHVGDVITAAIHDRVRVLKVLATGTRRGPAAEAQSLYEDMSPPPAGAPDNMVRLGMPARREKGAGRPTKRDRRRIDAWRSTDGGDAD